MKKLLFTLSVFLLTAAAYGQQPLKKNVSQLKWLTGTWKRSNNKPGQSGVEYWSKVKQGKLTGKGYTLKGNDTVFVEQLAILVEKGELFYVVTGAGNEKPVYFKFTKIGANGFECENPQHDFPKKIVYRLEGKRLYATVSGSGNSVDFIFDRSDKE